VSDHDLGLKKHMCRSKRCSLRRFGKNERDERRRLRAALSSFGKRTPSSSGSLAPREQRGRSSKARRGITAIDPPHAKGDR